MTPPSPALIRRANRARAKRGWKPHPLTPKETPLKNRTHVPGEVDALSNQVDDSGRASRSPAGILRLILQNRNARIQATGEDFVTGEEADWMLAQNGDFPTEQMLAEREKQARAAAFLESIDQYPGHGAG